MKWKSVPEEPTQQQIDAAWEFVQTVPQTHDTMRGIYTAMLSAAPWECKTSGMETVTIQRKFLVDLVDVWSKKSLGKSGSPNHSHSVPGVWDSDNGKLAGKPCAECALYDEARRIVGNA